MRRACSSVGVWWPSCPILETDIPVVRPHRRKIFACCERRLGSSDPSLWAIFWMILTHLKSDFFPGVSNLLDIVKHYLMKLQDHHGGEHSALSFYWWHLAQCLAQSMGLRENSVQFSRSVLSDSLRPHGLQHARPPCPSPTPGVYSDSCPLSWWCHPTISSSVIPFSSNLESFPTSGSFQMSQLFVSGGQGIGVSVLTSDLPMNNQDWSPLGWIGWTSL